MIRPIALLCLALASTWISPAAAQTFPVDDSASEVLTPGIVNMRWDNLAPRPGQQSTMTGQLMVRVRLEVAPWLGRTARIYQKLPTVASGPVTASWTTNGELLAGTVRDGERTLVYAGPIQSDQLEDTFRMTVQADGDRVLRPQSLTFSFEIELEP